MLTWSRPLAEQASPRLKAAMRLGHHLRLCHRLDVGRVNDHDRVHIGPQIIVDLPGVGGHLDHHKLCEAVRVLLRQVSRSVQFTLRGP